MHPQWPFSYAKKIYKQVHVNWINLSFPLFSTVLPLSPRVMCSDGHQGLQTRVASLGPYLRCRWPQPKGNQTGGETQLGRICTMHFISLSSPHFLACFFVALISSSQMTIPIFSLPFAGLFGQLTVTLFGGKPSEKYGARLFDKVGARIPGRRNAWVTDLIFYLDRFPFFICDRIHINCQDHFGTYHRRIFWQKSVQALREIVRFHLLDERMVWGFLIFVVPCASYQTFHFVMCIDLQPCSRSVFCSN